MKNDLRGSLWTDVEYSTPVDKRPQRSLSPKIDTRHISKIVIILSWFISAKIISSIWFFLRGKR